MNINNSENRQQNADELVASYVAKIKRFIGGELTAENMPKLNSEQITLLGWSYLHDEVMDGGYIQLIYNGYGEFIFRNPFAKAMRDWGIATLYTHLNHCRKYYDKYHERIERDMTDEEFMALYEQMPEFDTFDDEFIVNEEQWQGQIADYVRANKVNFEVND